MKKPIKYAIIGLIVLASVIGGVYYMMMPIPLRMTEISPQVAELSFMEQGIVTAENTVLVFPVAQGEINGLYVREGQSVRVGDQLLSVDYSALRLQLDQIESGIRVLQAQLANVDVEDANMRQNLQSARSSLQGELRAINAQAVQSDRAFANQTQAIEEQSRIQQVLIDQHQSELSRIQENFTRVQSLYQSGVATRTEFDAASASLTAAETQLEAAQGQMTLIATGAGQSSAEHFEGIRASINAQISGINQQLEQDTTSAAKAQLEALIEIEEIRMQQLQREIENTTITAPAEGVITTLQAQNTNFISAAAPVAEITVAGSLSVEAYVSTQDIGSINIGDTVGLTLRQRVGDINFTGRITEIDSAAVVRFTALGVEERKVSVRIEPNIPPGTPMGIGYALDVTFYIFREEGRIIVPRTAIFRDEGVEMVWAVLDGNTVEAVIVETGIELRTDVIIERGLGLGDLVVNDANNPDLSDGVRVTNER